MLVRREAITVDGQTFGVVTRVTRQLSIGLELLGNWVSKPRSTAATGTAGRNSSGVASETRADVLIPPGTSAWRVHRPPEHGRGTATIISDENQWRAGELYEQHMAGRAAGSGPMGSDPPTRLMSADAIDLERLLRLRVAIGRMGEMDKAQWWNTRGQLGPLGASAVRRGLPRTHYFAQARSVFAVAAHRCAEVFAPTGSVTLWRLPQHIETAFDARWEHWLDAATDWEPFFAHISQLVGTDVVVALQALELIDDADLTAFSALKTSAEGRAVPLAAPFGGTDAEVTQLALGFSRGRPGALAVPYAPAPTS